MKYVRLDWMGSLNQVFIDVCCTKTLTDELTVIGENTYYQREIDVLLDLALALVWRRCLRVR